MPNIGASKGYVVTTSTGTYVHANSTAEETVLEVTNNIQEIEVSYDISLLAQNTTIRVKEKMDGSTYEIQNENVFPTDYDANVESVVIQLFGKSRDQIITFQSGTLEGTTRDIPFSRRNVG